MQEIIPRVDRALIKAELTPERFLRHTNKGGNEIYCGTAAQMPNCMREIARLREVTFRAASGGTGQEMDIDEFDTMENPYVQLFVWDPQSEEILGGYRYILGENVSLLPDGQPNLCTGEILQFSDKFVKEYLPYTVELGRSFVQPDYQSTKMGAKSLFALDNLWDGLGAVFVKNPQLRYCFGKMTLYPNYNGTARDLIFGLLSKQFPDTEQLVTPKVPFPQVMTRQEAEKLFVYDDFKDNYKILNAEVRSLGVNVPPLVNAYMGLSPKMRYFGAAVCHSFGHVIECGIMVPLNEIYEEKKKRHIDSFLHPAG
ncbi:MAG: GNAT family N-acetyltransferase [Paludibacteraceae bacterium]|nr:GNAT family N-acetyltransferase [Paludibacteraceae bacterium]